MHGFLPLITESASLAGSGDITLSIGQCGYSGEYRWYANNCPLFHEYIAQAERDLRVVVGV